MDTIGRRKASKGKHMTTDNGAPVKIDCHRAYARASRAWGDYAFRQVGIEDAFRLEGACEATGAGLKLILAHIFEIAI